MIDSQVLQNIRNKGFLLFFNPEELKQIIFQYYLIDVKIFVLASILLVFYVISGITMWCYHRYPPPSLSLSLSLSLFLSISLSISLSLSLSISISLSLSQNICLFCLNYSFISFPLTVNSVTPLLILFYILRYKLKVKTKSMDTTGTRFHQPLKALQLKEE